MRGLLKYLFQLIRSYCPSVRPTLCKILILIVYQAILLSFYLFFNYHPWYSPPSLSLSLQDKSDQITSGERKNEGWGCVCVSITIRYSTVQWCSDCLFSSLLFSPTPLSDSTPTSMSVNDCTCSNISINQIKSEKERECDSLYSVLSSAVSFWFHLRPFFSWGRETAPIVCRSLQVQKHVQVDISDRVEGGDG